MKLAVGLGKLRFVSLLIVRLCTTWEEFTRMGLARTET